MKDLFANLSHSERRTIFIGGICLVVMMLYAFVWAPVFSGAEQWRKAVDENESMMSWMNSVAQEVKSLRRSAGASGRSTRRGSLLALVDQTARRGKLGPSLKRVEPKGTEEVRVRLEQAVFDDMIRWLTDLERSHSVSVDSISVDRESSPGRVNVTLTLKGAS